MPKQSYATISLAAWCANPYRDARDAIARIDEAAHADPDNAQHIYGTAWTGCAILTANKSGIPAAQWLPVLGALRIVAARHECRRVMDAMDMRMRAVERRIAA